MEILTDYTKPLPEGALVWHGKPINLWQHPISTLVYPDKRDIYAIPITHPATGDAKPDPLGRKIDGKEALTRTLEKLDAQVSGDTTNEKEEQRQERAKHGFDYVVRYGGGSGPDVWDAEASIYAVDIHDALAQAKGHVEECNGWITEIYQK